MIKTENYYAASNYYESMQPKQKTSGGKQVKDNNAANTKKAGQTQLSQKAQALLDKLQKTYSKMDFMVADFGSSAEAKEILSRGTKEVSVLFTSEEFEKMASDEKYEKEYMDRVEGALRMSEQINQEFGFEKASDKDMGNVDISKIGISFNGDGTTSYFAELEKSTANQKERIDKKLEDKRASEKEEAKKTENEKLREQIKGVKDNKWVEADTKYATVYADDKAELIEKMQEVDWDSIKAINETESGRKFNFSI